ncbi:MAG: acetylxylan esterase [Thermoproteales archaeon]|nr:acetylxylan esterase [Thermoproteales archaeon]
MNIYDYLCLKAKEITNRSLTGFEKPEDWKRVREQRYNEFISMLGLSEYINLPERPSLNTKITGRIEREKYTIYKIYYESLPKLYVTGNLYIPKDMKGKAPAILYLSGHALHQKYHYQAHPKKFAELGFVSLIIETIQLGEIPGYHHGTYRYGMFNWYSLGYTPAGVEVWNAIRAIDLLQSLSEVDTNKIGVTGISGGGAMTWYTAAADPRVKVAATVCGTATIESHICKRTINGHCDCMFWINNYMWDLADVGALIAPKPLLIASAKNDWIFDIESVRLIYRKLKAFYKMLGEEDKIMLVETPGPHSYHEASRKAIFKWFLKYLKDIEVSEEEIGDIELDFEKLEPIETLTVFKSDYPVDERVTTVQEWFIKVADAPNITSREELFKYKEYLKNVLMKETFSAFPESPEPLDLKVELEQDDGFNSGYLLSFNVENGWRIYMHLIKPKDIDTPTKIILVPLNYGQTLRNSRRILDDLPKTWAKAILEVRGTGMNSWSKEIEWFLRRSSMLTGRTLASIRVYDVIRGIEVLNNIDWIDKRKISLYGERDMAAVVLYSAFLKGNINTVVLKNPPPSQNINSNPDGTGNVIEMLNCLRYTDLPYIAGLLWPTRIVFIGPRPITYKWTEELYYKIGDPGKILRLKRISNLE